MKHMQVATSFVMKEELYQIKDELARHAFEDATQIT